MNRKFNKAISVALSVVILSGAITATANASATKQAQSKSTAVSQQATVRDDKALPQSRAVPELRALSVAQAKRDVKAHSGLAKSRLNQLKRQARSASERRIVAAAASQIQSTERQYRKAYKAKSRGIWIPAILLLARVAWAGRSAAMGMLKTCMRAKSCTGVVVNGAQKVTATTVASSMAAGQKRFNCFWQPISTIPLIKCLMMGKN